MKKYYSILILLLLVSMVSALDNDELSIEEPVTIYKLNYDCANIYENCDNCTQVNISKVLYPNGSVALSNVVMTKDNTYYNYTMCKLNVTGTYTINAYGDLNGQRTTDEYTIQVTPSGNNSQMGFYMLIIALSYGLLILGLYKEDLAIIILSSFALTFLGLWIMFYGLDIYKNYLTEGFSIITLGIAGYIGIRAGLEYMQGG